jgi:diguanylate cyclase (GGDEF)-like protein
MTWPCSVRVVLGRAGLALAAVLCFSDTAAALDPTRSASQYGHNLYTVQQGLPQNSVQAILQTRDGFLWMGTEEGLARFDGVRFTVFDKKAVSAFKDHFIRFLCEDHEGSLWIGTKDGLIRWRNGVFEHFGPSDGLPNAPVTVIFEDSRHRLWVGTEKGLSRRDGEGFVPPLGQVASQHVLAIAEADGALYFGTHEEGLIRLTDSVEVFTVQDGLSSNSIRALRPARDGRLWIGSTEGVDVLKAGKFSRLPPPPGRIKEATALLEDRDGSLWVGTQGAGVLRATAGGWEQHSAPEGLAGEIVLALFEDREGSVWIGLNGGGVNQLRNVSFAAYGRPEGLANEMALPILEDRQGRLWLGIFGGGLLTRRGAAWEQVAGVADDALVSSLAEGDGSLWVGTFGNGLMELRDGRIRRYREADGLPSNRVVALLRGRDGSLWVGTYGGGLTRFRQGAFETFGRASGLSSDYVAALVEGADGRLWVGTEGGGLHVLNGQRFRAYTKEQGLAHNTIQAIYHDPDGVLWVGTIGGLTRIKGTGLSSITVGQGLFDDRIFQILEDAGQNLWMSSNRGIFRVSKAELNAVADGQATAVQSEVFGLGDGMRIAECNGPGQPAGWRAKDGTLWFPTPRGVVHIDPAHLLKNPQPPPVAIEEVTFDKRPYSAAADVVAPPGDGEIEIHYTALSFQEPDKVRFKYRLVGFDRDWVDAGTRRVAYYTNIPPDRYRFEVIAANNDGVWNETGAALVFELRPHFYQARWFHVLLVFLFVALAYGLYQARIRQMAARERRLASLVKDRTRELEQANQMLARFSYLDAVTGIANRRNFDDGLDLEWRRLLREGGPLSLVMVDIDHFKAFNDTYGHQKGDECLKAVAQSLRLSLHRPGDLCARYGGEEFGVILPGTDTEGSSAVAEALRRCVEELAVPHAASPVAPVVTISVGVATVVPKEGGSGAALVRAADQALYQSKRTGRNRATAALPLPESAEARTA